MAATCDLCTEIFGPAEQIINASGKRWHQRCFVCAQCFQPFKDGMHYDNEGRCYCESDYMTLFGPRCAGCNQFITGKCITALDAKWHPEHFVCVACNASLAGGSFVRKNGKPMCKPCSKASAPAKVEPNKSTCARCKVPIEGDVITFLGETCHPYHFECATCRTPLNVTCKEYNGKLYCSRDYEKAREQVCAACKKAIDGRVVTALNKLWHPEHFVCAKCEQPFSGSNYHEHKGLPYCLPHYRAFQDRCFRCNQQIKMDSVLIFNKTWCSDHLQCGSCDAPINKSTKFVEVDQRAMCKNCYDKIDSEAKKKIKKYDEMEKKMREKDKKKK